MTRVSIQCGIAAVALIAGANAAFAADLPVKAVPMAPVAVYNWSGIYGGLHVGYGQGMKDWVDSSFDYPVKGFLGGGQIGVNQQIGNWVIGIEADASWTNIKGDQTFAFGGPLFGFTETGTGSTKIDALATVAGRLGFAQGRWLVYVKGGAAWARETHQFAVTESAAIPGGGSLTETFIASGADNRLGYVVGFGTEYAFWGNWSFKSEYNYIDLGSRNVRVSGTDNFAGTAAPFNTDFEIRQRIHLAKFGVNYRFGPDVPPAIAPAPPALGYNWTSAWVGAQGGYGFGRKDWTDFDPNNGTFNANGWLIGATTGASVQAGMFVVGAESEWMWTGIRGSRQFVETSFATTTTDLTSRIDWLSLNSIRVGFVAADRWLVYFKGGVAVASEKHDFSLSQVVPGLGSATAALSGSALHTGYLAGVGVEYAFLGNWTAKLEYNYVALPLQNVLIAGTESVNAPLLQQVGSLAFAQTNRISEHMHLVKFGINYHFTSLADVISARY